MTSKIEMTRDQKLQALLRLPWTVTVEREDDGSFFARVAEIPDALGDGKNERELARDLWDSLCASLALRLDHGDPIPLPAGEQLPWAKPQPKEAERALFVIDPTGPAWEQKSAFTVASVNTAVLEPALT